LFSVRRHCSRRSSLLYVWRRPVVPAHDLAALPLWPESFSVRSGHVLRFLMPCWPIYVQRRVYCQHRILQSHSLAFGSGKLQRFGQVLVYVIVRKRQWMVSDYCVYRRRWFRMRIWPVLVLHRE